MEPSVSRAFGFDYFEYGGSAIVYIHSLLHSTQNRTNVVRTGLVMLET